MNNRNILIAGLIFSLFLSLGASAQETKLPRKKMPSAVMSAFHAAYPKATIIGTSKEIEDGGVFYEVESREGKVKRDVLYKEDGSLVVVEEIIQKKALPDAVRATLKNNYSRHPIKIIEKLTKGSDITYEVLFAPYKGKKMEIVFDGNGAVIK